MTSRLTVDMPAPSVSAEDVARLDYLLNQHLCQHLIPLMQLDVVKSSAADKTQALHLALRQLRFDSLENDCIEVVKLLLKSGASVNQEFGGETALHVAATHTHCNDPAILRHLLDAGADLNATTSLEKQTALHIAVKRYHRSAVKELLSRGIRIDAQNQDGDTALHMAVRLEFESITQLLLDRGADPNCQNNDKETPFTCSLGRANDRISCLMLSKTAVKPVNVCLKNHMGETALHLAALRCSSLAVFNSLLELSSLKARNDSTLPFYAIRNPNSTARIELVRLLIRHGDVDPRSLVNTGGETMLYLAVKLRAVDVAEYLLESKKFDVNGMPGQEIPLFSALRNGDEAAVDLLLRHDARVDLVDQVCNWSTLQSAIVGFDDKGTLFRVCKRLLDRRAPLDYLDSNKETALAKALYHGQERLADLLIARGANIHLNTAEGLSPLHIASMRGLVNISKKLLDAGANPNVTDIAGRSVLQYAVNSDNSKALVKLLLEYGANCRTDGGALVSALINQNVDCLKLLLLHGADVNLEYQGKLPLAHAIGIHRSIDTSGCLLKYIALLASQGRPVRQENLKLIYGLKRLESIYENCIRELEVMKSTRLPEMSSVSYFDLLTESHESIARCLRYTKIGPNVRAGVIPTFIIYCDIMLFKCVISLRRLSMLQKLKVLLRNVVGHRLPCELIEMICQYFSDKELKACCVDHI